MREALTVDVISIKPASVGWTLESTFTDSPLVFRSGGRAELAAGQLATAAVQAGATAVDVRLHTRSGLMVENRRYSFSGGGVVFERVVL
jgi:hypothetical protein